jgi:membrane protease YdiL (CAAX protease family)
MMPKPLQPCLGRGRTVAGWIYLLFHAVILPIFLNLYALFAQETPDMVMLNVAYYALGTAFVLTVLLPLLRRDFDILLDAPWRTLALLVGAYFLNNILSVVVLLAMEVLPLTENPNQEAIVAMTMADFRSMFGLTVFLAPIVEESLFRGVVFGSLYRKSRILAYVVSIGLFCVYHIWQYVAVYGDPMLLLYAVQYLPISFSLCWVYERSGSVWSPIFLHMILNGLSVMTISAMG